MISHFSCDKKGITKRGVFVTNIEDDLLFAKVMTYNVLKQCFERQKYSLAVRHTIMPQAPINQPPRINPYNQVKLYSKYHQVIPAKDAVIN